MALATATIKGRRRGSTGERGSGVSFSAPGRVRFFAGGDVWLRLALLEDEDCDGTRGHRSVRARPFVVSTYRDRFLLGPAWLVGNLQGEGDISHAAPAHYAGRWRRAAETSGSRDAIGMAAPLTRVRGRPAATRQRPHRKHVLAFVHRDAKEAWRERAAISPPTAQRSSSPNPAKRFGSSGSTPLRRGAARPCVAEGPLALGAAGGGSRCGAERLANHRCQSFWRRFIVGISRSFIPSAPTAPSLAPEMDCTIAHLEHTWPRGFILPSASLRVSARRGCTHRPPPEPPQFHPRGCDVPFIARLRWPSRMCSPPPPEPPQFHPRGCDVSFTSHVRWPSRMCSPSASGASSVPSARLRRLVHFARPVAVEDVLTVRLRSLLSSTPQSDRGPVTHRSPRDRPSELNGPLAPRIALRLPTRPTTATHQHKPHTNRRSRRSRTTSQRSSADTRTRNRPPCTSRRPSTGTPSRYKYLRSRPGRRRGQVPPRSRCRGWSPS